MSHSQAATAPILALSIVAMTVGVRAQTITLTPLPEGPVVERFEKRRIPDDDFILTGVAFADIDRDGRLDVLFSALNTTSAARGGLFYHRIASKVYLNDGMGTFQVPRRIGHRHMIAADFDGDRDSDFLVVSASRSQQVYLNGHIQLTAPYVARIDRSYILSASANLEAFGVAGAAFFLSGLQRLPQPIVIPGVGSLVVDPASAIVHAGFHRGEYPVSFDFAVPIPNSVACRGLVLSSQALMIGNREMRLSNAVADVIQ